MSCWSEEAKSWSAVEFLIDEGDKTSLGETNRIEK